MLRVYYDDRCRMCSREIAYYQKITLPNTIEWKALSEHIEELQSYDIDMITALKHLHAITTDKQILTGVDAFIAIWRELPRWHYVAKFASLKLVKWMLDLLYEQFAKWRFKRSKHCQLASNKS